MINKYACLFPVNKVYFYINCCGGKIIVKIEELKLICDAVVKLTELRQNECKHLLIENFAPECLENLLAVFNRMSFNIHE